MQKYNPEKAPDSATWLNTDEQERIMMIEKYHNKAGIKLPNVKVHAAVHAIVENQIAEGFEPSIQAMSRLISKGNTRHEAMHIVGEVLLGSINGAIKGESSPGNFEKEIDALGRD